VGGVIMNLTGRNAIVTGSTSGIGEGIARALASQGCNVMLNGFGNKEAIDSLVQDMIKQYKVKVLFSAADMSKPSEIQNMVEQCNSELGSVDILVNNAGIQHVCPIDDFPTEKWDAIIAINLSSSFHSTKAALKFMRKRNFGRIINIASAHGLVGSEHKIAYCAAKHGIVGLTKVVALETAENDITCNAICPGWVKTPLVERQIEQAAKEGKISIQQATEELLREKQPKKIFNTPESIGNMVAFLCNEFGNAMTGEIISMDGGWTAL
jgi:3-hydroxybutyrate dehydrogenase